ncbi:hypothetical protein VT85_01715 [Planctomyces sp. SH-PL62]|nr:hypothetical protein VT85_01715 [Planctomyces sp. SH-PL62]
MRCFGNRRVASYALGMAALLGMSLSAPAKGDGWRLHPTLPGEVPAYDYTTGGEYFAPPVPYGHYAKDPVGHAVGAVHGAAGHLKGKLAGLHGLGAGCGAGCGHGHGNGHNLGDGLGHHGRGGLGDGCGLCSGLGGCKHGGAGIGSGLAGLGGHGLGKGHGHGHAAAVPVARPKNFGPYHPAGVVATAQSAPSPQALVMPAGQVACGDKGCGLGGLHNHLSGLVGKLKCKLCGGNGCGGCGGLGLGDPCSSCGGNGCGACRGCGLLSKLKQCLACGGAGCKHCLAGLGGLKGKLHGLLGGVVGPKYDYFVGAGGPVPLTPGYVPYIVTTRSPRDFFAFPPMTPDGF